jgi:hypothetical protein
MLVHNPILPPKSGYVEVDISGKRMYKNINDGSIIDPDDIHKSTSLTHEEINKMVVDKIRERYDMNEEFKMINLGISDATNTDYISYRQYVETCVNWGNELELNGGDFNE